MGFRAFGHEPGRGYKDREGQGVDPSPDEEVLEAVGLVTGLKPRVIAATAQQEAVYP